MREPQEPGQQPGAEALTLNDVVEAYIRTKEAEGRSQTTLSRYRSNARAIAASPLGQKRVMEVGPVDVEEFISWRRERCWSARRRRGARYDEPVVVELRPGALATNATVNRDLLVISASLSRLVRLGQLAENPASRVTWPRERRKPRCVLHKEEIRDLVGACSRWLRPLVVAGLFTGARAGELIRLCWRDLDFRRKTISLYRPKVGNASVIPLHPTLAEELGHTRQERLRALGRGLEGDEPVFVSKRGLRLRYYTTSFRAAVRRAGLGHKQGLSFHSLRHCFAVHFLEGGAAVTDLQALLGHASLSTTQIYARAVDARTRASVEALSYGV